MRFAGSRVIFWRVNGQVAGEPQARDEGVDLAVAPLAQMLAGRRFVTLTGAGCSTESGIPDYRGNGRAGPRNPIQHDAFLRDVEVRRRYWARATLGWQRFTAADYRAALAAGGERPPLRSRRAVALWDANLGRALLEADAAVEEETVLEDLLADLGRAATDFTSSERPSTGLGR